ncbi:hypothetical protein PC122_g14166 [Phytophthora cactorum]|nr:hypothetical protein PC122_g14166 [Phytophthora cactorum]
MPDRTEPELGDTRPSSVNFCESTSVNLKNTDDLAPTNSIGAKTRGHSSTVATCVLFSLREEETAARDAILDDQPAPPDDLDQLADSDSPIFDTYLGQGGSEAIVTLTSFTVSEFYLLYGHVEEHYSTWHKHALEFGFKPPTFEKVVHRVMDICEPVLRIAFVVAPSMSDHCGNGRVFSNYPYALYAVDVKFQPALRPSGRFEEAPRAGAVSDITILSNHVEKHRDLLRKSANESLLDDRGEDATDYRDSCAVLADKGYQGAESMIRAVHPKKKPKNGELTADEVTRTTRVSSDRVIVEHFFCVDEEFYRSVAAKYSSMAEERRARRARTQRAVRRRRDARLEVDRNARARLSYVD